VGTPYTPPGKDPTGNPLPPKPKPVPAATTQEVVNLEDVPTEQTEEESE